MRWRGVDMVLPGGQSGSKGAMNSGSGSGGSLNDSLKRIAMVLGRKDCRFRLYS